ncbi:MAG TPA: hypothetical protein C5S37_14205 [Methanophagales archaeon]|nr:hypothetical protein [Methanophagales archaeon]
MNDKRGIRIGIASVVIAVAMLALVPGASAWAYGSVGNATFENGTYVGDGWQGKMENLDQVYTTEPWPFVTAEPYIFWDWSCAGQYEQLTDRIHVNITSPDGKWYGETTKTMTEAHYPPLDLYVFDVILYPVAVPTYTISGYTDPAADTVKITNLNNSKEWAASIYGNFYNLTLDVGEDVNATEILQIVACEELPDYESNCNVTTHVPQNIPGEDTNVNLTLDHYCLNWMSYPYKTWEQANWSGPAVMEMMIDHYRPPGFMPSQTWLNATGIGHNQGCNADLQYVDPLGMKETLNEVLHNTTNGGRYANYGIGSYDTVEQALWYICYWQYLGPGAAPTYGNYSNWMAIRGIHTSVNPKWKSQGSYDIYGFWINDPKDPGGIGENSYKCVDQWTDTYHLSLTDVRDLDSYKNRYVAICEPPEQEPGEVRLVHSKARFSGTITAAATDEELTVDVGGVPLNQLICNKKLVREKENKVVQAAIEGVNEQLAPYDRGFKKTFDGTVAGKPMPVKSDAGDYYLVPFGIESDGNSVLAVVIVDSDGGKFKEASWVNEPVKYLSVTPQEALKIVYKEMKGKSTIKVLKKDKATGKLKKADVIDENVDTLGDITLDETEKQRRKAYLELVYQGESPYYPVWKITIGDSVFFVDQSGTLTYNEPVSTPTPTPKLIKSSDTQVLIE